MIDVINWKNTYRMISSNILGVILEYIMPRLVCMYSLKIYNRRCEYEHIINCKNYSKVVREQ